MMANSECLLVAVGRQLCSRKELEFRISFSRVEQKIISNFNETQMYCFVLLKFVLKEHVCNVCDELISSYCIKTLILWTLEWDKDLLWSNFELILVMQRILSRLFCGVLTGFISHFFVPEYNILEGKITKDVQTISLKCIQRMYGNVSHNLIQNITYLSTLAKHGRDQFDPGASVFVMAFQTFDLDVLALLYKFPDYIYTVPTMQRLKYINDEHVHILQDQTACIPSYKQFFFVVDAIKKLPQNMCDEIFDRANLENITFISEIHSHIKLALLYMHTKQYNHSLLHLNRAMDLSSRCYLHFYSLGADTSILENGTENIFMKLLEVLDTKKKPVDILSNDGIWNYWCKHRELILRGKFSPFVPLMPQEKHILPLYLQYEVISLESQYHSSATPVNYESLTLSVFLTIYCYIEIGELRLAQTWLQYLKLVCLGLLEKPIGSYRNPPTINLAFMGNMLVLGCLSGLSIPIACVQSTPIEFSDKTAVLQTRGAMFSFDLLQYAIKLILSV